MNKYRERRRSTWATRAPGATASPWRSGTFQGYGLSILRIEYLVPRMFVCAVVSCSAILRIEGCPNGTL